ncbi:uncharacterized protein LODBEIA_P26920 [Lodderomyces beijingensis]|uniref:Phosphoribulokinase/uridine kinase domain-containing protein n=1 Tax=Lodderomyces beijingensis TaxID=1775926 RepID=A0ABP0ZJY3_9ASCO
MKTILVLLGGGHAAGKKTTATSIKNELVSTLPKGSIDVRIIDMNKYTDHSKSSVDSSQFTTTKSAAITISKEDKNYPLLKPSRFDFRCLKSDIAAFGEGKSPSSPQRILLVHGLYALYDKELRDSAHIKVFIDSDPDSRLIRWIRRDVLDLKQDSLEGVINAYLLGARSEMSDYIFPTKEFADVIMPRGAEHNAVSLVIDGILLHTGEKNQPKRLSFSANYLRPTEIGNFEKERFDVQKNKFYQLS